MKFSDLVAGISARKNISPIEIGGQPVKGGVDVRRLSLFEQEDVYAQAIARAKAKGVEDPSDGNPIYDLARMSFTILRACVDPDAPPGKEAPFFSNIDEIGNSYLVTKDTIAHLFSEWEMWEDEGGGRLASLSEAEFVSTLAKLAGGDSLPFLRLQPNMQVAFVLRTAGLAFNLLASKSVSTSTLQAATKSASAPTSSEPASSDQTSATAAPKPSPGEA